MSTQARAGQAPKKAPSPAQIRAGQKFAAGGRNAQARAAANPKTAQAQHAKRVRAGKKAAATRKRNQQAAARQAQMRGKKQPVKPAPRGAPAPADAVVGRLPGWSWLLACNDVAPTCAAAAVANHLYACTGLRMKDADVMSLHKLAGGDEGATIEAVLECIQSHRSAFGDASRAYLIKFVQVDNNVIMPGLIVGVRLGHAGHAVVSTRTGMISWGRNMPFIGEPQEAWALEWSK